MSYLYSKLPETGVSPHIDTGGHVVSLGNASACAGSVSSTFTYTFFCCPLGLDYLAGRGFGAVSDPPTPITTQHAGAARVTGSICEPPGSKPPIVAGKPPAGPAGGDHGCPDHGRPGRHRDQPGQPDRPHRRGPPAGRARFSKQLLNCGRQRHRQCQVGFTG